jgi:hypothetical protein
LRFMIKYQKCGDTAIEFGLKDIRGIINSNMAGGMLTIMLSLKPDPSKTAS